MARRLLLLVGFTGGTLAAACTSEVRVERENPGRDFTCDRDTTDAVLVCTPVDATTGVCPEGAALDVAITTALGPCESEDPDFCWCDYYTEEVLCGPNPAMPDGECCYYAEVINSESCEGRPFVIDGAARTADSARRVDWSVAARPALDELDAETRRALADTWTEDALAEHASVASFARFIMELMSVGAPAELVADAQAALADEIRHAQLCFGLASAYAGRPVGPDVLPIAGSLDDRRDLATLTVAAFEEGCVNETLSALTALAARDRAADPAVRATLSEIGRDEVKHAELAWRFVAWAVKRDEAARQAVWAAVGRLAPFQPHPAVATGSARALVAHGRMSGPEHQRVLDDAIRDVVLPCTRGLLSPSATSSRVRA